MGIGRQRPPRQVAYSTYLPAEFSSTATMDAIRKKMKSLKDETDQLYAIIQKFEDATKEANRVADQADCDIRDYGKKVHGFEIEFDETLDKLNKANEQFHKKDHADGGGGQEGRDHPGQHCHQAGCLLKGGRRRIEKGEGCGEQVHEQRGDP